MRKFTFFLALILCAITLNAQKFTYPDAWGKAGFNLVGSKSSNVQVTYSIPTFSLDDFQVNGKTVKEVSLPGNFLPNDAGMPNLPGQGRYIAIPQGSTPKLTILSQRTEVIHNVDIVPAFIIPAENNDQPLQYVKNAAVYSKNAYYPAEPIKISSIEQIRGVDVVILGITPFQYNPVTKDLIVYRDIKVDVSFDGGNGHFGDDAYRSRWFDPILQDAILNADALPVIDYNKRLQSYNKQNRTDECEYIIISPTGPDFLRWADSIANFRNQQGILTKVFTVDEVGGNTATAIEAWIDNAYNSWTIKPVACMMFGDFGADATKNVTSPIVTMSAETFPSDHKLGDVNADDMAEIVFSRVVANNNTQLTTICTKLLDYERNPPTDTSYYQHPITALGWQTERWFQLCSEVVGGYFRSIGKHPVRINAIYQGTPGSIWSSATNTNTVVSYFGPSGLGYIPQTPAEMPCCWNGGTAAQVNTAINDGSFLLQHRDHGMETGWGEPSYTNSNIDQLTNIKPTFVMSINCLTGKYNWGSECFGERFIRHTKNGHNAGALGLVCPSEVSYSFVNDTFAWGMYDNMWPDFMPAYGTTPASRGACPAFGMVAGKYFLKQSSWPYNTSDKKITYYLFHMHSDAFLRLFTEQPQQMTITHDVEVLEGATVFNITANADADISLTVNNEIIAIGIGAGTTPVAITIPAQTMGSVIMVTVTKQNFFRYNAMVPVTSGALIPNFTANATSLCHGTAVDFSDLSNGTPTSWEWTFAGGNPATSVLQNPTGITYAAIGNYDVTLVVHKGTSTETTTKTSFINVYNPPVAAFVANAPCIGTETNFTDQSNGNGSTLSWAWNFGDPSSGINNTSILQNPTHLYATAGTYNVTLTAINSGCSNEIIQEAQVLTIPEVAAAPTGNTEMCASSVNTFTTTGATFATSYAWEITPAEAGTFTETTATADLTVSGTYTGPATIKVKGINDCGNGAFSTEFAVTIMSLAVAPPAPTGIDSVDVHMVTSSDFVTAGISPITTYSWFLTPAEAGTIAGSGTTGTVTWSGDYHGNIASVSVKAIDNCGPGIASDVKNVILKNSVGIAEQNGLGVELFPNPTSGKFTLKLHANNSIVNISILNAIGSPVYTENNLTINETVAKTIDFSKMAQGVYYIKIEGQSGIIIKKLVVQK